MRVLPVLLFCSLVVVGPRVHAAEAAVSSGAPPETSTASPKPARQTDDPGAPRRASRADVARYEARQAASPRAAQYEGGDSVVIIGASTVTLAAAILLLVILL